jgi:hypothetical protein
MKSTIFWDITPCSLLKVKRHSRGTYHLHLQCQRIQAEQDSIVKAGGKQNLLLLWNVVWLSTENKELYLKRVHPSHWKSEEKLVSYKEPSVPPHPQTTGFVRSEGRVRHANKSALDLTSLANFGMGVQCVIPDLHTIKIMHQIWPPVGALPAAENWPPLAAGTQTHAGVSAGGDPTSPSAPGTYPQTAGPPAQDSLLLHARWSLLLPHTEFCNINQFCILLYLASLEKGE